MSLPVHYLWLIPALPLLAAVIAALTPRSGRTLAAGVAIAAMVLSFFLSCSALATALAQPAAHATASFNWFDLGNGAVRLGWLLDPLTAFMCVMVTFVSTLIFIFSLGYMKEDANFTRFFCFLSLFAAAMLGILVANSLLLLFVCWELVGLASYLLIGFWFHKPEAAAAAKKAFIVTRIGDLGFLLGILWLYDSTGSLLFYDGGQGVLEAATLGGLARPNHRRRARPLDCHRPSHFLRRGRQVRPVSAPRLAARRDGRPDARLRSHPCRHHGRRRRVSHRPRLSPHAGGPGSRQRPRSCAHGGRFHRRDHRAHGPR